MTVEILSEADNDAVVNALTTWFESQGLTRTQGVQVMVRLINVQIVSEIVHSKKKPTADELIKDIERKLDDLHDIMVADTIMIMWRAMKEGK